jgi:ribosomal protein S18 acetylase RimI-like enzyme
MTIEVQPVRDDDREWIRKLIRDRWEDDTVVANGTVYHPAELDGFVARQGEEVVGLATYRIDQGACEIVTIDALVEGRGIGGSLIEAVHERAHRAGCARLWVITTNDNERAQAFYDKVGFRVAAVREGAANESRKLKPSIPLVGRSGIAITDEIEYDRRIR